MSVEEIHSRFYDLVMEVNQIKEEIEADAHLEFINSLKQFVNKY